MTRFQIAAALLVACWTALSLVIGLLLGAVIKMGRRHD